MAAVDIPNRHQQRLAFLMAVLLGIACLLMVRLFYWQVVRHGELSLLANEGQYLKPDRRAVSCGDIRDRGGHLLASDVYEYEISAAPSLVTDTREVADRLALVMGLPRDEVLEKLSQWEARYIPLQGHVPYQAGQVIQKWNLRGIYVDPRPKRVYPLGELFSPSLGFVGFAEEERAGYYGVEGYYSDFLQEATSSSSGWQPRGEVSINGRAFLPSGRSPDLILSLDQSIQLLAQRELLWGLEEFRADSGTIIVMEPKTGRILAMVSHPTYDPNEYEEVAEENADLFINPAVNSQYEPGSVFKIVTMAAALDSGLVTPDSVYEDTGSLVIGGRVIYNWNKKAYGVTTMRELLQYSLNVGASTLSIRMGSDTFYGYVSRFGFGQETGVDLAGEVPGLVKHPGDGIWHPSDLATNSFGQGIAVTPLQMVNAMAAVANGGKLMQPRVVEKVIEDGETRELPPMIIQRVLSEKTAAVLTEMLAQAVEKETRLARIEGYRIAGKTGTAQIPDPERGGYDPELTIASFIGFAPVDDPQFVILVRIDKPRESPWGSMVAAPVFKRLAEELFVLMDIPPDEVRLGGETN